MCLKIVNFYNIPIRSVKKIVTHFFDKEKYVPHHQFYLNVLKPKRIKTKITHRFNHTSG